MIVKLIKPSVNIYRSKNQIALHYKNKLIKVKSKKKIVQTIDALLFDGISDEKKFSSDFVRKLESYDFITNFSKKDISSRLGSFLKLNNCEVENKRIVFLGCGSLATHIISQSLHLPFKDIILIDFDVIEKSNIDRQSIFKHSDIGRKKTEVLSDYIHAHSGIRPIICDAQISNSNIEKLENLIDGNSLVIQTADTPSLEITKWVISACINTGSSHIKASSIGISPYLRYPYNGSCSNCATIAAHRHLEMSIGPGFIPFNSTKRFRVSASHNLSKTASELLSAILENERESVMTIYCNGTNKEILNVTKEDSCVCHPKH
ncbi:ThiF family adenylyltransferase [Vibrio sp. CUB2]|uniref:ThiF family adenylyltransferase n=1 Tax=Vibrio sp. CUB2 TaxID=2315233 RepID=UPI00076A13F7|nr:ThiF family adenylyltransferase [Vibrio sp. CUB2]